MPAGADWGRLGFQFSVFSVKAWFRLAGWFGRPASRVFCDSAAERRSDVAMAGQPVEWRVFIVRKPQRGNRSRPALNPRCSVRGIGWQKAYAPSTSTRMGMGLPTDGWPRLGNGLRTTQTERRASSKGSRTLGFVKPLPLPVWTVFPIRKDEGWSDD